MIVVPFDGEAHLVTQNDHARLAAEILSLWQRPRLAGEPGFEELLFAAREHDNGWREADAAPYLHPAGDRAHDFLTLPQELRIEIWRRGTARYESERPYAALLITEHARTLFGAGRKRAGTSAESSPPSGATDLLSFLDELEQRREALLEVTGSSPEEVEQSYPYLHLVDFLSLLLCNRWQRPYRLEGRRARLTPDGLVIAPFPLAGATTFELPYRTVPIRPYSGDRDLAVTLAAARWQRERVRVIPEGSV